MIRCSFNFIPNIGDKTERLLWNAGVYSWDDLRDKLYRLPFSENKRIKINEYLEKASLALSQFDASFFADHLASKDYWRVYPHFANKLLFLDIETTGLSLYYDEITLIGSFNGNEVKHFIKDINLNDFPDYIKDYQVLVTFNGKLFDVPFIAKQFPDIKLPVIHIDLRFLLKSLGMGGPLKNVESKLGISRPVKLRGLNGREAVLLWSRFLKGDDRAMETLLTYNSYDTSNLQLILDYCYETKAKEIRNRMESATYQLEFSQKHLETGNTSRVDRHKFPVPKIHIRKIDDNQYVYINGKKSLILNRKSIHKTEIKLASLLKKIGQKSIDPASLGIDLTGSEKRASGLCFLRGDQAYLDLVKMDSEIITIALDLKPSIISIDSPLSLPTGRCCVNDSCTCRKHGITRECERILRERGIHVYPCLIPSMQNLTARGIQLAKQLREEGFNVIESYPGAAQDILGLPRKRVSLKALETDLLNMGIKPISRRELITHDEIDALTSALVGYFYQADQYEALGNTTEEYLIIPAIRNREI